MSHSVCWTDEQLQLCTAVLETDQMEYITDSASRKFFLGFLLSKHLYTFTGELVIWCTVKPEITHTFGEHKKVWVITGYGFSQVYFHMFYKSWWMQNGMGYYRL